MSGQAVSETKPKTLDDHLSVYATLLQDERDRDWSLGDFAAECVRKFGKGVISKLAGIERCSRQRVGQRAAIAAAFPPDYRLPDCPWDFYREVYWAAKRLGRDPRELFDECREKDMSTAEVRLLGKDKWSMPILRAAKTCPECGCRTIVYALPQFAERDVRCGICGAVIARVPR